MADSIFDKIKKKISQGESGGNHVDPKTGKTMKSDTSSATGKYQIVQGTWNQINRQLGGGYNIHSERDQEIVMDTLLRNYSNQLIKAKLPVNETTMYMMHLKGDASWVKKAINNPNAPVSSVFSANEMRANKWFPKTLGQLANNLAGRVSGPKIEGGAAPTMQTPEDIQRPIKKTSAADAQKAYSKYNAELSEASKKFTGPELIKKEESINKRYAKQGWFGSDNNGRAIGPFNDIIRNENSKNEKKTLDTFNDVAYVANNIENLLKPYAIQSGGMSSFSGRQNTQEAVLNFNEKNNKRFLNNNTVIDLNRRKLSPNQIQTIERVLGRKIQDNKIPVAELLKKVESKMNPFLPEGQTLELIKGNNELGKDFKLFGVNGSRANVGRIIKPGTEGSDFNLLGFNIIPTAEQRTFVYNPNSNFAYKKKDELSPNPTWDVPQTAVAEKMQDLSGQTDASGFSYERPDYNLINAPKPITTMAGKNEDYKRNPNNEKLQQQGIAANDVLGKAQMDKLTKEGMPSDEATAVEQMLQTFSNSNAPVTKSYDPRNYKGDIPWEQLASSALGIFTGMNMAKTPLPERNETVSEAFVNYASELSRLSEIGLSPEDEAYAKRMISESYSSGLQQLQEQSNGNRNIVLGNLGRLDFQKQQGLLALGIADHQAKMDAFYKYGEAMKYINEFDTNRDVANNERKYQNALLTKQAGSEAMVAGWKSLMDGIQYYKENKPGSVNHMYKSYMTEKLWDVNPNKVDNGRGDTPGTKSYNEKILKDATAVQLGNKEAADTVLGLPMDQRKDVMSLISNKGWSETTKSMIDFIGKNKPTSGMDVTKFDEAQSKNDWSLLYKSNPSTVADQNPGSVNYDIQKTDSPTADKPLANSQESSLSPIGNNNQMQGDFSTFDMNKIFDNLKQKNINALWTGE